MSKEERETFARELRRKLDSRRDVFVLDKFMFEPQTDDGFMPSGLMPAHIRVIDTSANLGTPQSPIKKVSAAALKLLLDYCESDWDMDFVSYCAGVFHGRCPNEGETAFDLLPDITSRLSADRLGFGHIYGGGK